MHKIEGNNSSFVIRTCFGSPFEFISERDAVDKRLNFRYDNSIYSFSSSVENVFLLLIHS